MQASHVLQIEQLEIFLENDKRKKGRQFQYA